MCVPVLGAVPALMGADGNFEKYLVESGYWQNAMKGLRVEIAPTEMKELLMEGQDSHVWLHL